MTRDDIDPAFLYGVGLALFFVAGFLLNGFMGSAPGATGTATADGDDGPTSYAAQQEAIDAARQFLAAQFPPFVTNISTVSISKDARIEGVDYLYNWTAALTVEPNSFGSWATNTTRQRVVTFYVSPDGDYIFSSTPRRTTVQQQGLTPR
ncbi:MAG: hypothetical protein SV186_02850 [Candidatus Nanohaloarchaea archaeon]|nr:hypothetical protein [Candidatus Nanohaloarchaea archaeon]